MPTRDIVAYNVYSGYSYKIGKVIKNILIFENDDLIIFY